MYAIGVDSGTQGTKVLVVDFESGRVLGRGMAAHRSIPLLKPGESEQAPQTWIQAFEQALSFALREAKIPASEIRSVGVSAQQHGFVPLDSNGRPIRPAKLWNDTSTIDETKAIVEALGGKIKFIEKLGINLAVGYTASKILWLKRHETENFQKLRTVHLPHNYINFFLTGISRMEYGDASGTGLMDIRKRQWHPEVAAAIDPDLGDKLPELRHPKGPLGYIKNDIAAKYGMHKVLVSSGGGDNMMAAIGTGNVSPGVCTLSLGTSGTVFSYFAEPFSDPEGEIAAFCDSTGGWLPLLCTMNVTNTTEIFKALHKINNEELEEWAAQAPAGADGLIFLPFIDGERVPVLPHSSGSFFGLTRRNFSAAQMARSVMEGTILNLGYGFARMRSLGLSPSEIRATGGGARSGLWLQIVADVFKTPVITLSEQEAAAYGAALQAIWCYSLENSRDIKIEDLVEKMVKKGGLAVAPQPRNFPLYDELQARFNSLWKTLEQEFENQKKLLNTL
jgi:xylulokinase